MKYRETLLWNLRSGERYSEEKTRKTVEFVHSLGLKCDCVGWTKWDLSHPRTPEILQAIRNFCAANGWTVDGYYQKEIIEADSDWFELRGTNWKDSIWSYQVEPSYPCENTEPFHLNSIRAYQDPLPEIKGPFGSAKIFPDRFRKAYEELGIGDVDFCWLRDRGKYEAPQFFRILPKWEISTVGYVRSLDYGGLMKRELTPELQKRLDSFGGALPELTRMFAGLDVTLPYCYLAEELPERGIAACFFTQENSGYNSDYTFLIHRDTAKALLEKQVITQANLQPALVGSFPEGYGIKKTDPLPRPPKEVLDQMLKEYEKLIATPRPQRKVTDKEALKLLRKTKKEQKEFFAKALPKAAVESLAGTPYEPLAPYYGVTNGAWLGEGEYEILSYERSENETEEYLSDLKKEELWTNLLEGIAFGICGNGDRLILLLDGKVIRASHEAPEILEEWPSVAQFFCDIILSE